MTPENVLCQSLWRDLNIVLVDVLVAVKLLYNLLFVLAESLFFKYSMCVNCAVFSRLWLLISANIVSDIYWHSVVR